MRTISLPALAAIGALMLAAWPAAAAPADRVQLAQASEPEPLAQSPRVQRPVRAQPRPRARIRVYSRYPYRAYHSIYPISYPIEYPGPNAVRHCVNNYVVEHRPSGDVVVPRTRCWWAAR